MEENKKVSCLVTGSEAKLGVVVLAAAVSIHVFDLAVNGSCRGTCFLGVCMPLWLEMSLCLCPVHSVSFTSPRSVTA